MSPFLADASQTVSMSDPASALLSFTMNTGIIICIACDKYHEYQCPYQPHSQV